MSLPKLFERIFWHNNTTPAINETNLNAMSKGLSDVDDRLIGLAGTLMEDVPQIIEDMATVEAGLETVGQAVTDAQTAATAATADKLKSEGFAVGEQNGVSVDSSSPYYHNNAKYYSQVAPPTAAAHVSYDHSQSHLAATNVQGAVDELKEALTDEAKTRASLGAHNLVDISQTINGSNASVISGLTDNGFTVTTTSGAYGGSKTPLNLEVGERYRVSFKVTAISGLAETAGKGTIRDSGNSIINQIDVHSTGDYLFEFTYQSGYWLSIMTTSSTAGTGTITVSEVMVNLTTDSDPTYQPYAKTNVELTADKADKSDLASIRITGTTNNTGATIASGTYFYLKGDLVKAKTSIANGATLTKNTNYEEVTAGALNVIKDYNKRISVASSVTTVKAMLADVLSQAEGFLTTNDYFVGDIEWSGNGYYLAIIKRNASAVTTIFASVGNKVFTATNVNGSLLAAYEYTGSLLS